MTPEEEIEHVIKEIATNQNDDIAKSYRLKSFPEIYIKKFAYHYSIRIMKDYRENYAIIQRFRNVINSVRSRKITIENKIIDRNRDIRIEGHHPKKFISIYYKNCIFTCPNILIGSNCENCINVTSGT